VAQVRRPDLDNLREPGEGAELAVVFAVAARPPRRLIPVAALDLHLQFYTSKIFPEMFC
jgi:hypothetical protein